MLQNGHAQSFKTDLEDIQDMGDNIPKLRIRGRWWREFTRAKVGCHLPLELVFETVCAASVVFSQTEYMRLDNSPWGAVLHDYTHHIAKGSNALTTILVPLHVLGTLLRGHTIILS